MLSLGTKSMSALGLVAVVASVIYGVITGEGSGTTVLAFVGSGALALAVIIGSVGPDRIPVPVSEDADLQQTPAGNRPLFPSIWPLAGGVAMGILAIGAATEGAVVVPAIVIAVAVLLGWVFQAWTEHPTFTARFGARLSDRLLVPLGLPVAVFGLVVLIALSLSRVLLTLPEQGSRIVAIVVAMVILGGAFFIVSQERMARAALSLLSVVALLAVVGAGAAGFVHGERKFERKGGEAATAGAGTTVSISARDTVSFSTAMLAFPAQQPVTLVFDNQTAGVPHNVGIFDHDGGKELFAGMVITGPAKMSYHVPPLGPGSYHFHCDVHPNMMGTLVVGVSPGPSGPGAASGPAAPAAGGSQAGAPAPPTTAGVTAGFATTATTSTP